MLSTLIFWGFVTWLVVSPDKASLSASRGLWGAVRGFANPQRTTEPVDKADDKVKRPKIRPEAAQGSRWAGLLNGWNRGVHVARQKRANGRDLWSRGSYVAGRAWGGSANLRAGLASIKPTISAWRAKRAAAKGSPTVEGEVIDPDPTEHPAGDVDDNDQDQADPAAGQESGADDVDVEQGEGPTVVQGEVIATRDSNEDLATDPAAGAAPSEGEGAASTTTNTENTTGNTTEPAAAGEENTMGIDSTELESLDAVAAEVEKALQMCAALTETLEAAKAWANGLADRWSGTGWGTRDLDTGVATAADAAASLGDTEALEAALRSISAAVENARTLAEHAENIEAQGPIDAFRAA